MVPAVQSQVKTGARTSRPDGDRERPVFSPLPCDGNVFGCSIPPNERWAPSSSDMHGTWNSTMAPHPVRFTISTRGFQRPLQASLATANARRLRPAEPPGFTEPEAVTPGIESLPAEKQMQIDQWRPRANVSARRADRRHGPPVWRKWHGTTKKRPTLSDRRLPWANCSITVADGSTTTARNRRVCCTNPAPAIHELVSFLTPVEETERANLLLAGRPPNQWTDRICPISAAFGFEIRPAAPQRRREMCPRPSTVGRESFLAQGTW